MHSDQPSYSATNRIYPKRILTPKEFHEALDGTIGLQSIYEMLRAGRIKSIKIGTHYKIPCTEVDDFISREAGLAQ